jgi:hypothetical protein
MSKYGEFGIAFPRPFLVNQGASPVFYIAENAIVANCRGVVLGDHLRQNPDLLLTLLDCLFMNSGTPPENATDEKSLFQVASRLRSFIVRHIAGQVKAFDAQRREDDSSN